MRGILRNKAWGIINFYFSRMNLPSEIQIYHIVHIDKLPFILADDGLLCDAEVTKKERGGTCIGLGNIKQRRLKSALNSYKDLHVGDCVPFYFCYRSVMLYFIHKNNKELAYQGGQEPIVHLVADLCETIDWAEKNGQRWVFTSSNAGSDYFEDYADSKQLDKINWDSVNAIYWKDCKEDKQAEFLLERYFPWTLVKGVGVYSSCIEQQVMSILNNAKYIPEVKVVPNWYYKE
jgi:hypothetical protein